MNYLRYLAIISQEPEQLAAYYQANFQLAVLGRTSAGGVALTDGYFNLSILADGSAQSETDPTLGLHHVGIAVEDLAAVEALARQFDSAIRLQSEPRDRCHGEYRILDPNGQVVSLSTQGFGVPTTLRRMPYVAHIAMSVPQTERVFEFYRDIFGFREVNASLQYRKLGRANRFMGDGRTNLTIHPERSSQDRPTEAKMGVNHYGFLCADSLAILAQLGYEREAAMRPSNPPRPYAEYRIADLDGNAVDVSQRGYEVDLGRWVRPA